MLWKNWPNVSLLLRRRSLLSPLPSMLSLFYDFGYMFLIWSSSDCIMSQCIWVNCQRIIWFSFGFAELPRWIYPGRSESVWMQPKEKMWITQLEGRLWECRWKGDGNGWEGKEGSGRDSFDISEAVGVCGDTIAILLGKT